jgi:hypothetical protein
MNGWITDKLPDSDMTVLMRLSDKEFPVWPGFHDGEQWMSSDASTVEGPVLGWMELEDAAKQLDGHKKAQKAQSKIHQPSTLNTQPQ